MDLMIWHSVQATSEEIDYLKRLHELKLKQQLCEMKRSGPLRPSMIIDDSLYHGDFGHAQNVKQTQSTQHPTHHQRLRSHIKQGSVWSCQCGVD